MEREGINAFFRAQQRDAGAVLDDTIDALWTQRTKTVLHINPERLSHQRENLPPIDWTPRRASTSRKNEESSKDHELKIGQHPPEPATGPGRVEGAAEEAARRQANTRSRD